LAEVGQPVEVVFLALGVIVDYSTSMPTKAPVAAALMIAQSLSFTISRFPLWILFHEDPLWRLTGDLQLTAFVLSLGDRVSSSPPHFTENKAHSEPNCYCCNGTFAQRIVDRSTILSATATAAVGLLREISEATFRKSARTRLTGSSPVALAISCW
jgi:hypothetical protein